MTSNLLGVSVTGLRVAQSALNTTGHNIANAGVEGYSRQRVISETNPASLQNGGYVGNGTRVTSIERVANDFIDAQLRFDTTLFNDLDVYYDKISQLDTLLSDVSTGLSSGLETFFASMQNGADDPRCEACCQGSDRSPSGRGPRSPGQTWIGQAARRRDLRPRMRPNRARARNPPIPPHR